VALLASESGQGHFVSSWPFEVRPGGIWVVDMCPRPGISSILKGAYPVQGYQGEDPLRCERGNSC